MELSRLYYSKPATELAPNILGKIMCRKIGDCVIRRRVTETECYFGEDDSACHASHGRTKRSEFLYRAGGIAYVYRCHMYYLLTLVTGQEDHPEGVLIRGLEGINGPGRVGMAMNITPLLHGAELSHGNGIWFEDDGCTPEYFTSERIGISSAEMKDKLIHWRFFTEDRQERPR